MATASLDRDVLAKIGTDALIASGYTDLLIRQWRRRGISWRERAKVQRLAAENGVTTPGDFLERQRPDPECAPKPAKKRKAAPKRRRAA